VPSVKDADHSGHASKIKADKNVNEMIELILDNRKVTVFEVANILGM
jgi:hypothetical protein